MHDLGPKLRQALSSNDEDDDDAASRVLRVITSFRRRAAYTLLRGHSPRTYSPEQFHSPPKAVKAKI